MKISASAYYAYHPKQEDLALIGLKVHIKALFDKYKQRIGSRTIKSLLNQAAYEVGRYKIRSIMRKLELVCQQRRAFKVTTKKNDKHQIQPNLLNQNFQPLFANEVWSGDITYIKTNQGWRYVAVVKESQIGFRR